MGRSGGNTVWLGTAFNCHNSNNEITLLHTQFPFTAYGECNNGTIVARSWRVQENVYTSQLTVSVSAAIIGRSIMCIHDSISSNNVVGSSTIEATTGCLLFAKQLHLLTNNRVHVYDINFMQFHFHLLNNYPSMAVIS